jgi:hypothetical protein
MMHCARCLGYNHTEKYCTSPIRCVKCGESHETATCQTEQTICVYCSSTEDRHSRDECPVVRKRAENLSKKVAIKSKTAYKALCVKANLTSNENYYASLAAESESDDVDSPLEGTSYAQVLSGRGKRPRSTSKKTQNREPPTKRSTVPNTSKPESQSERRVKKQETPEKIISSNDSPLNFITPWMESLRAGIFKFVKSFEWPQIWEKMVLDILGQLIDNVLPKISSFVSSIIPSLFRNGQS